jgi:hypothetical protein
MKKILGTLAVAVLVAIAPGRASAQQDLQLTINDGRATLIAQNVPVSRILAEWARIGQATVVNGEKIVGPPVTLHFENQPESEVLQALLRSVSGYVVAPRATAMANASAYDRILILPTSRAPAVSAVAPPQFNRQPPPVQIEPDVDEAPNDPVLPPGMQPPMPPNMPQNVPLTQPRPGMPDPQQQVPMTQPRPGMPTAPNPQNMPGGFLPNPYGVPPQQPTGVLPPGVRPPTRPGGGGGDDR